MYFIILYKKITSNNKQWNCKYCNNAFHFKCIKIWSSNNFKSSYLSYNLDGIETKPLFQNNSWYWYNSFF